MSLVEIACTENKLQPFFEENSGHTNLEDNRKLRYLHPFPQGSPPKSHIPMPLRCKFQSVYNESSVSKDQLVEESAGLKFSSDW